MSLLLYSISLSISHRLLLGHDLILVLFSSLNPVSDCLKNFFVRNHVYIDNAPKYQADLRSTRKQNSREEQHSADQNGENAFVSL